MRIFGAQIARKLAAIPAQVVLGGILLVALAWKLVFFFWDVVPFNSDEAVVALMARHILQGARPIFFYGQAYMGSLDAYLVAAGFGLFGQQVWVIRLVQGLLYLGVIATTALIARVALDSWKIGLIAALLLAFPAVNTVLYTTASLGGYGEAMLIGNLILLLSFWIVRRGIPQAHRNLMWAWLGWGFLAGCGLWANGLTLVYSAPAGLYLILNGLKRVESRQWLVWVGIALAGFAVGALPWWIYAGSRGPAVLVRELFGEAVSVEGDPWILRTANHLLSYVLLGVPALLGFRPPWNVQWLALPLLPLALIFWMGVIAYLERCTRAKQPNRAEFGVLAGVMGVTTTGFLFTSFGIDPSGRYFLPFVVPLALGAAGMILSVTRFKAQPFLMVLLVLAFHVWGTLQCAVRYPPGLTTQFYEPSIIDHRYDGELVRFLRQEGETRGYTNYWVAYPLAFLSGEDLIFIPRLPYQIDLRYTPRDDRYAPYTDLVAQSERTAYITMRNPDLDAYLVEQFTKLGVTWREQQIGDYHIYYHLSQPVRPQQIGLGEVRK